MRFVVLVSALLAQADAAYPPQDPSSSLDALLRDVWARGPEGVCTRRPHHAPEIEMQVSPKSHLPDAQAFAGADFVHFLGPDTKLDTITECIYLNLHPDHIAEVMRLSRRRNPKPAPMHL
jgi:hypothetical protein